MRHLTSPPPFAVSFLEIEYMVMNKQQSTIAHTTRLAQTLKDLFLNMFIYHMTKMLEIINLLKALQDIVHGCLYV